MILFHHIPKTAGSTFNHAVIKPNPNVSCLIGAGGIEARRPLVDLSTALYIGGHITYGESVRSGLADKAIRVTMIRDPIKRIVSHFEMAYRDNRIFREEICGQDKWGSGFEVFYQRFISIANINNIYCQYFSAKPRFYDAVVCLLSKFTVVATVERFDDFQENVLNFFDDFGLNKLTDFVIKNVSSKSEKCDGLIDPKLIEKIRSNNEQDLRLFDWIESRHDGLYVRS
ncbi:MAG: sulfotransferase family 2 domain-containing protein [Paracoccaceae bacterium]